MQIFARWSGRWFPMPSSGKHPMWLYTIDQIVYLYSSPNEGSFQAQHTMMTSCLTQKRNDDATKYHKHIHQILVG